MLAVVGELDACDELRVSHHGCHALPRGVVVHTEALVGAGGGGVGATSVQNDLD